MPRPPMSIHTEFPAYPVASLPNLEGFIDTSWRNDTSPSFRWGNYCVWVDWPDETDREIPGECRFVVCLLDDEGCLEYDEDTELETNDWGDVLSFLADRGNAGDL